MSTQDDLMEVLQADVHAILGATPALALANLILMDAETVDSKIELALKTLTATDGKRGLGIIVMRPEVTEAEKNLPGPPLTIKIEIQCVEQTLMNRDATSGTQLRSSAAALNVLAALHLQGLGNCLLYADKDPIKPVQVKTGYVSDSVTLFTKFNGLAVVKPLGVEAAMGAGSAASVTVLGDLADPAANPVEFPVLIYEGEENGAPRYSALHATGYAALHFDGGSAWELVYGSTVTGDSFWAAAGDATSDLTNLSWYTTNGETGSPEVSISGGAELELTCATPASTIHYTTDGSYPSPFKTVYTAPITGLATGTVVRAAAYVTGRNPGDVLEFTIRE